MSAPHLLSTTAPAAASSAGTSPARRPFVWLLWAVGALCTGLWLAQPDATDSPPLTARPVPAVNASAGIALVASADLAINEPAPLGPARFDPFVGTPLAPLQPAPKAAVAVLPPESVPLAPAPPPALAYRFVGRMVSPQGQTITWLARADHVMSVEAGQRLDEGYVVESIDADAMHLYYPPLNARMSMPLPPPGPPSLANALRLH